MGIIADEGPTLKEGEAPLSKMERAQSGSRWILAFEADILTPMKILFVLECANRETNGTSATCLRFAEELRKRGHEVRIIGCRYQKEGDTPSWYIPLPYYHFPLFNWLIEREGFNFCRLKGQYHTLYDAVKWADLVHLFLPFKLSNQIRIMAQSLGVPVTSAFHLQPQNVTCAIHLGKWHFGNWVLYHSFRKYLYNQVHLVHCPSEMIARELKRNHYDRNECHVISNGVSPFFHRVEAKRDPAWGKRFVVVMSGRLASEKRQDLLIRAVAKSKHKSDIQIVLCGMGPNKPFLEAQAKKHRLSEQLQIHFCDKEALRDVLSSCDLYVHCSDYEIEGISAIEAICCGAIPVISDARFSATNDFSLDDEKCLFHHGSPKSLAEKIDYFYEHPEEIERLRPLYLASCSRFLLSAQVDAFEAMFAEAVQEEKEGKDLFTLYPRKKDERKARKIFRALAQQDPAIEMPASLE